MKNALLLLLVLAFCTDIFSQNKEIVLKTDVSEATVFINGAQVIRKKNIDLSPGVQILRFSELSPYIDAKSVQVRANDQVVVLSVNHQFNYTDSVNRSKIERELDDRYIKLDERQKMENVNLAIIGEELSFMKDNRNIGGKNEELNLNNFKETSAFYHERILSLKLKEYQVKMIIDSIVTEKSALERQIRQITTDKPQPTGEVLVKLNVKTQTKCELELSYFVNNAGWYPSYDIRVQSIDEPVNLTYKANIRQNTKEEWKNVKLKLSSTNPNLGNVAPQLQTYFLNYNTSAPRYSNASNQVFGKVLDAETRESLPGATVMVRGTTIGTVADANGYYSISTPDNQSQLTVSYIGYQSQTLIPAGNQNDVYLKPDANQLNEVVTVGYGVRAESDGMFGRVPGLDVKTTGQDFKTKSAAPKPTNAPLPVVQTENQTSFEFEIKTPYTISSDNKNTTVDIDNLALETQYEYHCVPKIDKDAFLMAQVTNWEKYNLLEGEASIYFENTFVGKSVLDVRNASDTLKLSLGRDKSIVVKREKIKDMTSKQFLGSKKEESRTWQMSVKNNKNLAVVLNLYDQVPVSSNAEIEVIVDNLSGGILSKEKGEVKWNIKLSPGEKKDLVFRYSVKYPKERVLNIE